MLHCGMLDLQHESDVRILRQVATLQQREIERLHKAIAELAREVAEARKETPEQLAIRLAELQHQLEIRNRTIFGPRSERRGRSRVTGAAKPEPDSPRKGHGRREQPNLLVVEVEHELPADGLACKVCSGSLEPLGNEFEESEEIDIIPPQFVRVRHKRRKYRCKCNGNVQTASGPVKLQPGARYSPAFAVEIAADKYLDHLPLERQVRRLARAGLDVDSQTLWDQIEVLARALQPTYEAIGRAVLGAPLVGADETHWRVMGAKHAEARRWWVWGIVSPGLVFFRILDSRSQDAAAQVLGGYSGIVMADGYGAYDALSRSRQLKLADGESRGGFTLVHCWAHVRRKFFDAGLHFPQAREILDLIGELYAAERQVPAELPAEERTVRLAAIRTTQSREVIARIEAKLATIRALPESALGKAVAYTRSLWTGLTAFLDDPRIPLDNNKMERELRPIVLGRKNYGGSRSRRGTEVAALFYTLFESARLAGKDPKGYVMAAAYRALAEPGTVTLPEDWDDPPE